MSTHMEWWNEARADLARGGHWLRGDEPNRIEPALWGERPYRVLLSRLSTWEDTRESFTHRLLHGMLSDLPGVFPDISWLPPHRDGERMTNDGVPWLLGSGTKRGASEFDCVALSNALVQELVNVPVLLERSGIPLSRSERMERADVPLVILGGANALCTSALFGPDPMVDGIFLGEDPEIIRELFSRLARAKDRGLPKREAVAGLADLEGFFVPDNFRPQARKARGSVEEINRHKIREVGVAAAGAAASAAIQVSEGCPFFCSFCAESWSRKPYREASPESVRADALSMKRELGLSRIDLYSFNFNTCEHIRPLLAGLLEDFDAVGLKSQRFDAVARDPTFPRLLKIAGKTSITCGLEGISPRLRAFLQKDLSDDDLYRALSFLLRERLREIKVFLVATGEETEEDFEEYKRFLRRLRELLDRAASRPRVVVSATPLVRFPWTPLEFLDMPIPRDLSRILGLIKAGAVLAGFEYRSAAGVEEAWVSQALARARDGRIMDAVRRAQARTGFVFRDGVTGEFYEAFREELAPDGADPEAFVRGYGPEDAGDRPWAGLEPGVSREAVVRAHAKCRDFEQTPSCLGWVDSPGHCQACGACTPPQREAIVHPRASTEQDLAELERRLRSLRTGDAVVEARVELSDACVGLPMELVNARHARAWMLALGIDREYRRHEAHGRSAEGEDCLASGLEVLRPVFRGRALDLVRAGLADPAVLERVNAFFQPHGTVLGAEGLPAEASAWTIVSPEAIDLAGWLGGEGIKHTLRRDGSARVFEIARESRRKKIVHSVRIEERDGSWRTDIEAGAKFSVAAFSRSCLTGRLRTTAHMRRIA